MKKSDKDINPEIAKIFFEIADMLEMKKVQWKPQAYRRAAKEIINLRQDVSEVYSKSGIAGLEEIPAVGSGIAKKIAEYIKIGKIKAYEKAQAGLPKGLAELSKVPGIGPKRAKKLYEKLNIKSINDLKSAVNEKKISVLEGFGSKSEQNIAEALDVYKTQGKRRPFSEVNTIAIKIKKRLEKIQGVIAVEIAGSLRRKSDTIRDIDMLAVSENPKHLIEYFTRMKEVKKIIAKGTTKAAILLINNIETDLRVVPEKSYGAALLYFTGSKEFNIRIRQIAIKKGFKLSEYGLFDRKTGKFIAGKTEEEIFKKLGIRYVSPEQRGFL